MAKGGITPFLLLFFLLVANQLPGATSLVPLNRPGVETASLIQYPFVIGSGRCVHQHPLTTTTMRRTAMTTSAAAAALQRQRQRQWRRRRTGVAQSPRRGR